jgi:Tat protein secretion system quality control protein TatD with DNase activity
VNCNPAAALAIPQPIKHPLTLELCTPGCDLKTSRKAQEIAHQHQGVYFTAGVHPHNAKDCGEATLDSLRGLISDSLCVAVGECGLDFNRNFSPADVQEEWFDKQVRPGSRKLYKFCKQYIHGVGVRAESDCLWIMWGGVGVRQ